MRGRSLSRLRKLLPRQALAMACMHARQTGNAAAQGRGMRVVASEAAGQPRMQGADLPAPGQLRVGLQAGSQLIQGLLLHAVQGGKATSVKGGGNGSYLVPTASSAYPTVSTSLQSV